MKTILKSMWKGIVKDSYSNNIQGNKLDESETPKDSIDKVRLYTSYITKFIAPLVLLGSVNAVAGEQLIGIINQLSDLIIAVIELGNIF